MAIFFCCNRNDPLSREVTPEELSQDLKEERQRWYEIGKEFKIPIYRLQEIDRENHTMERKLDAVLLEHRSRERSPTVGKVIEALEDLDLNNRAETLRRKYSGRVPSVQEFVYNEHKSLNCKKCGNPLANTEDIIETTHNTSNEHSYKHTRVNPHGYEHTFVTFKKANGYNFLQVSLPTAEHSWFTGYQWTILVCAGCKEHKGWLFQASDNNARECFGRYFYGLLRKGYVLA